MPFDLGDQVRVWGGGREGSVGEVCGVSGDGVSSVQVYFPKDYKSEWMECGTHQVIKTNKPQQGELNTSECVSEVKVSSQYGSDHGADKLTDGDDGTYWQTAGGTPPPHWVRVEMKHQYVAVHHISVRVGQCGIDWLPRVIELWGGDAVDDMTPVNTVNVTADKKDGKHWVKLLDDTVNVTLQQQCYKMWEVRVTEVHGGSKGCVVWALWVTGDNMPPPAPPPPPHPHTTADTVHELSETMKTIQNESAKELNKNFNRLENKVLDIKKEMENRVSGIEKAVEEVAKVVKDKMSDVEKRMQAFDHRIERVEDKEMSVLQEMSSKLDERLVVLEGRQSGCDVGLTAVGQQVADLGVKIQQDMGSHLEGINTRLEASEVKLEGMLNTRIDDLVSKMGEEQENIEGKITELEKKQSEESERHLATQNRNNDILDVCRLNAGSFLKLEWQRGSDCSETASRTLCDVIILDPPHSVAEGEEEGDSEPIRAHSNVLCTRATGFLDFLTRVGRMQTRADNDRPANLLYITDFYPPDSVTDKSAVRYVIDFCYNKTTGPLNLGNVENIYRVSEMIGVEDLKQACSNLLQDNISADNYVKLYHTALNLPSVMLQTNVEKFVLYNLKDCLKSANVINLSLESFLHFFSMDNLGNLDSEDEVVLYEAIIRWVKAESFNEEIRARCEERLTYLEKLMHLVKFINIDKDYLKNQVRNESIVKSNEGVMKEVDKFLPGRR